MGRNSKVTILAIALLSTACSNEMAPVFPVMRVETIEPADGSDDVFLREPIRVTFSEPIAIEGDWTLRDGSGPRAATSSLDGNTLVITVTPTLAEADTALELTISGNWTGASGLVLEAPVTASFVAPTWLAIGEPLVSETRAELAVDSVGRAVIARLEAGVVHVERESNGVWNRIGDLGAGIQNPSIAAGRNGELAVAWEDGATVHASRFAAGGWSDVTPTLEPDAQDPAIAIDSKGRFLVAYSGTIGGDLISRLKRYDPDPSMIGWSDLGRGSFRGQNGTSSRWTSIALDDIDSAFVAFSEKRDGTPVREIGVCRGSPLSTMGPLLNAAPDSWAARPRLVTLAGAPIVAWTEREIPVGTSVGAFVREWRNEQWLEIPSPALAGGIEPPQDIDVIAADGELVAVFVQDGRVVPVRRSGATWAPISEQTIGSGAKQVSMKADPWGLPVIAWSDGTFVHVTRLNR